MESRARGDRLDPPERTGLAGSLARQGRERGESLERLEPQAHLAHRDRPDNKANAAMMAWQELPEWRG